jgi:hypothetical protein
MRTRDYMLRPDLAWARARQWLLHSRCLAPKVDQRSRYFEATMRTPPSLRC